MCFFTFTINGQKYSRHQAQAIFDKMNKEIDALAFDNNALKTSLEEALEREAKARRLYEAEKEKVINKNIEIRLLKEKAPVRGKGGRFVSKKKPC